MRRVTRNGVIALAAASGAMAVTMPAAAAAAVSGSGADGSAAGSPGLISGNTIQLPVHVPANVCGNTVNVVGALNPAVGNSCANEDGAGDRTGEPGGAAAHSSGKDSPGTLSGNGAQLPVHVPVNVSGNTVNVVGVGNASVGNDSSNTSGDRPARPERPHRPAEPAPRPTPPRAHQEPEPAPHTPPRATGALAHTGTDRTLPALAAGAALVLGGVVLRRRVRPAPGRAPQSAAATAVSSTVPESP